MSTVARSLGIVREGDEIKSGSDDSVILHVTHNVFESGVMEKRFDKHLTIAEVKWKVQTHFGTDSSLMILQLKTSDGQTLADNMDDGKMLGFYSPQDGQILHAVDLDPNAKQNVRGWTDVSLVQKYEMTDEDYAKRDNSVRQEKLKRMEKLRAEGKLPEKKEVDPEAFAEDAAKIKVGDRCIVFPGDRKATIRYVGKIPELKPGYWVGVEFDEPVGKNDGKAKQKRYFECQPNYGGFTTPDKVTVGDFPPNDIMAELAELDEL
ncbi:Tubulin-folding cofactor B [Diplonema papillatum]|nr:Tubulin-folding cofactor B [Diplonema papillatum]